MSIRDCRKGRALIAVLVAASLGPFASWAQQSAEVSGSELQEVIVTAAKRTENLQTVPVSVTALSSATIETQGITNFSDYLGRVPGLANDSGGAEGHGNTILRGLNTGYYATSPTVGFYVDDTPYSPSSSASGGTIINPGLGLVDLDHIEVLKGPQGTLYGASTLGGLIKMVTTPPDLNSTSGSVQADGSSATGGGLGFGLEGILNLPIIPGYLAVRASVFEREAPGYMTNTTLDTTDRGGGRKEGGRITFRWVPQENLDIRLSAFLQSLDINGWDNEFVNLQTLAPIAGNYTYQAPYEPTFHTTYEVYNLSINYVMGSIGKLTNSTSYNAYADREVVDFTPYAGSVLNSYAPEPVPADAKVLLFWGPTLKKFTDELRFSSNRIGPFEGLAGLYFTREQTTFPNTLINAIPPSYQPIPGPSGLIQQSALPATYKESAAFADLTYYLTEGIDLTVGGRYSHNEQDEEVGTTGFTGSGYFDSVRTSGTDITYQAALRWRVIEELNTYARVATGYRPGGAQSAQGIPGDTSFKPDTDTTYEIGLKGLWLDKTLRTNLAVYYTQWKNIQITSLPPNGLEGDYVISNAGRATVKGVEFETQYVPINRLTLGATLAYTESTLVSISPEASAVTGAQAGDSLPYTPKWAGSATADYVRPLNTDLNATVGATYRYQGTKISDYPADPNNTGVAIPAYRTADVRAGLSWSRYTAQFRVANVFGERGIDTVADQRYSPTVNAPAWAVLIPPRTYTVAFSASF
jgi:iron complex outermembrane receptor protein